MKAGQTQKISLTSSDASHTKTDQGGGKRGVSKSDRRDKRYAPLKARLKFSNSTARPPHLRLNSKLVSSSHRGRCYRPSHEGASGNDEIEIQAEWDGPARYGLSHLCSQFGTPPSLQGPTAKMRGPLLRLLGYSPTSNRPRPITASAWNCRGAIDNSIWSICRRCRQRRGDISPTMCCAAGAKATLSGCGHGEVATT